MVIQATQRVILSSSSLIHSVTDDFTMHLVDIAKKALQSPYYQPLCLGILRSDYMIDQSDPYRLLQVLNCIFINNID